MYITKNNDFVKQIHHTEHEDLKTEDPIIYYTQWKMISMISTGNRVFSYCTRPILVTSGHKWYDFTLWLGSAACVLWDIQSILEKYQYNLSVLVHADALVVLDSRECSTLTFDNLEIEFCQTSTMCWNVYLPARDSICRFLIPQRCERLASVSWEHHRRYKEDNDSIVEM